MSGQGGGPPDRTAAEYGGKAMPDVDLPRHSRVNLRRSFPGLYHRVMAYGVWEVLLAVNFWWKTPTFIPFGIPTGLIAVIFFVLGSTMLLFLNVHRDLRKIRLVLALSAGFAFFWGVTNTQQVFAGNASFQLPIMFVGFSVVQVLALIEAPVNPTTERSG